MGDTMEEFIYKPQGVCSREMRFIMDKDIIKDLKIIGGCAGNLLGISMMIKGRHIHEILDIFTGIKCGNKATSCPDQISLALQAYAKEKGLDMNRRYYEKNCKI